MHKLVKAGISGKLYNIIRSIYSDIKSCVKVNGLFSEYFSLQVGLIITGDSHLPILFSFFINYLEKYLHWNCCLGNELKDLNLFLLFNYDDIVIFLESVEGLQNVRYTIGIYR